jgi:hypothetical protein
VVSIEGHQSMVDGHEHHDETAIQSMEAIRREIPLSVAGLGAWLVGLSAEARAASVGFIFCLSTWSVCDHPVMSSNTFATLVCSIVVKKSLQLCRRARFQQRQH